MVQLLASLDEFIRWVNPPAYQPATVLTLNTLNTLP